MKQGAWAKNRKPKPNSGARTRGALRPGLIVLVARPLRLRNKTIERFNRAVSVRFWTFARVRARIQDVPTVNWYLRSRVHLVMLGGALVTLLAGCREEPKNGFERYIPPAEAARSVSST